MSDGKNWRQYAAGLASRLSSRSRTELFMPGSTAPELLRRSEEALREGVDVSLALADRIAALEAENAKLKAKAGIADEMLMHLEGILHFCDAFVVYERPGSLGDGLRGWINGATATVEKSRAALT